MAPSKTKPNPFLYFMQERKPKLEKQFGRRLRMDELPPLLHPEWKELSIAKKEKYVRMCDNARVSAEKLDSRGIPLSAIEQEIQRAQQEDEAMKKNIASLISSICSQESGNGIINLNFYVVSFQVYGQQADGTFMPAEIGLVQFNFRKGITSEFHRIFKANIPKGYLYQVLIDSDNTHNLFEYRNYAAIKTTSIASECIAKEVKEYLSQNLAGMTSEYILYTPRQQFEVAKNIFKNGTIKIYSLDYLYMQIYNFTATDNEIPVSIAEDALHRSDFDYNPSPACMYHKNFIENSVKFCALSEAKRLCYNMCQHINVKRRFNIDSVLGRHLPDVTSNIHKEESDDDSYVDDLDKLSVKSGSSEASNLLQSSPLGKDRGTLSSTLSSVSGAWASPSTVSSVKTADESEFPLLGSASSYSSVVREFETTSSSPGVKGNEPTYRSAGLRGLGRGRPFSKDSS